EFQDNMVNMATNSGMDSADQNALSLNIRDWSLDFNQDQKELQSAATTMIAGGITTLQDLSRFRLRNAPAQMPGRG
ncbi:hypothetical protein ACYT69_12275, partial [Streptococcus pyogenes]